MTTPAHPSSDYAELALAALEWLESRDELPETVDETLAVLADQRRRLLLEVMDEYGESITLPDAAEEVAKREAGRPVAALSAEEVANVYISLYHDHLPRLVGADLVEYNQDRDLVSPGPLRNVE
ncbi:DUF7344 domain-containing protein [Halostagnicola kamekurae]|uniref:DUF7344 domain-containing protein n=1 Tax=Halostagnicola kamekurae TaxID=619731 RepID=A0A1I6S1U2_9EURY|nr:hypothetical protein [Halostagnicola kamekurae]SFS70899.1 hypothetical protein SAMN04488556_2373 [Halostagnicola kamekurae]